MIEPGIWVSEEDDWCPWADELFASMDTWFLATFSASDGEESIAEATLDEALDWARERSRRVVLSFREGDSWSAGAEPVPDLEPWDPAVRPAAVRRRPESERWKDRTPSDPAILWTVEVSLAPTWEQRNRMHKDLAALEGEVGNAVAATKPESWTRKDVDAFFAAIEASTGTWVAPPPRWILTFEYAAATRELASGAVKRRVSAQVPEGWDVFANAAPAEGA